MWQKVATCSNMWATCSKMWQVVSKVELVAMPSQHTGLLVHGSESDEVVFDGLGCGGVDVGLDGLHLWHKERK